MKMKHPIQQLLESKQRIRRFKIVYNQLTVIEHIKLSWINVIFFSFNRTSWVIPQKCIIDIGIFSKKIWIFFPLPSQLCPLPSIENVCFYFLLEKAVMRK